MGSEDVHGAMTPIIDLGPTPRPFRYQKGTKRHVAWPFWAFKVGVAIPPPRRFNVLERFVLKASLAGARRAGRIAEALQLERELVDYLVDDLTSREYLDAELVVTECGEEALRDDEDKEPEWITGHIFKDAVSRKLWPRFVRGPLNPCNAKMKKYGRGAEIPTGTEGKPGKPLDVFVVWPEKTPGVPESPPRAPDPFSAGDAIRRAVRAEEQFERNIVDDDAPRGAAQSHFFATMRNLKSQAGNTRLIDEKPQPCFVLTHVHMPENMERSASWQVCDPFGLGLSSRLRRTIREWIDEYDAYLLRKSVVERATDGAYEVDDTELSQLLMARYESAASEIEGRFQGLLLPEDIRVKLCQMEHGFQEAKTALESKGKGKDEADRNVRAFLRAAQAGLEELFAEVLSNYLSERTDSGSAPILSKLNNSSKANGNMLTELAGKLGLDVDDSTRRVLAAQKSRAKGVIEYGNPDLFTAFSLLVLQAADRPDHPLRQLSNTFPQVASFVSELKNKRGAANHAAEHRIDPGRRLSLMELEELRDDIFRVVEGLLPASTESIRRDELAKREESWDAELMCKLRAASAQEVRKRVGRSLNDRPVLKGRLVELVQTATELDVLARQLEGEDHSGPVERKLQDLVFAAGSACEALAKSLVDHFSSCEWPDGLSSSKDENRSYLVDLAEKANFRFDPDGEHAETLLMVNPYRLQRAVEEGEGSLNALVWAALIRAEASGDGAMGVLREVAASNHRYLDDMARISAWRGHGNKMMLELDDAQDVVDTVFRQVKAILDSTQ